MLPGNYDTCGLAKKIVNEINEAILRIIGIFGSSQYVNKHVYLNTNAKLHAEKVSTSNSNGLHAPPNAFKVLISHNSIESNTNPPR